MLTTPWGQHIGGDYSHISTHLQEQNGKFFVNFYEKRPTPYKTKTF